MKLLILYLLIIPALVAQGTLPMGSVGTGGCGTPPLTHLKYWGAGYCMTGISPCSTSYTNGHSFTNGEVWKDRSGNGNDITLNVTVAPGVCTYSTNILNSLPGVNFGGPNGSGACAWAFPAGIDAGATSWAMFIVWQDGTASGSYFGSFTGANQASGLSGTFNYVNNVGSGTLQSLNKAAIAEVAHGTAAPDLNFHEIGVLFSNQTDQNSIAFRRNEASDPPLGTTSQNINTGMAFLGLRRENGIAGTAIIGTMTEVLLYDGTGVLLSAGDVTTVESYLKCIYPSLP